MSSAGAGIEGVDASCLYGPILQESIGDVLSEVAQAETISRHTGLIPMFDVPGDIIPELEDYLAKNPCRFVHNGVCPVAKFAILRATGEI